MALSADDIQQRFGKHAAAIEGPNPNEAVHNRLREAYVQFAEMLNQLLPDSRDTSLAFTSLEEASMWAHKAAVRQSYEVIDLGSSDPPTFEQELVKLLNKHGMEKGSNTADWILCEVLRQMLIAFDLAFEANDGDDEYAVLDFAKRAVRALDVGVRLRERQGAPTEAIRQVLDEPAESESEVIERADGFHIEETETPETVAATSVGFSLGDAKPDGSVAPLLEHFGIDSEPYVKAGPFARLDGCAHEPQCETKRVHEAQTALDNFPKE